jgi:GDPmannose 4,6-dehydratase
MRFTVSSDVPRPSTPIVSIICTGDLTDATNLIRIIQQVQLDEIYNLAAQSHVQVSFETPEYTANSDALGTLRILEAVGEEDALLSGLHIRDVRQGSAGAATRDDTVLSALSVWRRQGLRYWITVNYREAYGMYACNGILFNHESPIRGETFVTRKITRGLARIKEGLQETIYLGNLDSLRDWGHARDYVQAQWLMLQQEQPEDFAIATGEQHSVREFVEVAGSVHGMPIKWRGNGVDEQGIDTISGRTIVKVDSRYFRPTEVDTLLGDPTKAGQKLGWRAETTFEALVNERNVEADLGAARRDALVAREGFAASPRARRASCWMSPA